MLKIFRRNLTNVIGFTHDKTTLTSQINVNSNRYKQNTLFYGFFRLETFSHYKQRQHIQIPIGIVNLCSKFYQINLQHFSLKQRDHNM